jgi:hypothetical protein
MTENPINQPERQTLHCPQCDAVNRATAERCWLCDGVLPVVDDIPKRTEQAPPDPERIEPVGGFSLASLMLFMTLACVVLGVISIAPGLGVPLAIVAFFAWLRTSDVVRRRAEQGSAASATAKIELFLRSFGFIVALLALISVASGAALFSALFTMCALAEPSDSFLRDAGPYGFGAVIICAAAIFGLVKLIQFGRRQRRRDLGKSEIDPATADLGIRDESRPLE